MKKHIVLFILFNTLSVHAVERVSLAQLQGDWAGYTGRTIELTDELTVCGSFYDSLVLAPERLFCPEERAMGLADGDSTMYWEIVAANRAHSVCVHCNNAYYAVRVGDKVHGLRARVTSERQLLTGQSVKTKHGRVDKLAKPKKGELRIVGANIENYFADLGGYATKKTTPAQQELKTKKLVKALRAMHGDIYACCEMQVGDKAPRMLLKALNGNGGKYAYISLGLPDQDRIGGLFLYDSTRVRPIGEWMSAYRDSTSHYHSRIMAQGFEAIDRKGAPTGKKLIVSLSHYKSKRPGRGNYDTNEKRLANADSMLTMLPKAIEVYGDSDVLLLGDYNCYTQEAPIQKVIRAGYADMLPHGEAPDYSYTYKGEAGYLDRCFASPTMAGQIVRVRPWHVNADWYYQHAAYRMKDKTYHRYADHEPIIVDINLR